MNNKNTSLNNDDLDRKQNLMKEIGKKIRQAREEAKMSQFQVGVALGITDKTISGYESGRIAPPIDKLLMLSDLFKKPITYFIGVDPKEYKVSSRLKAVESSMKEIRNLLNEIKIISQSTNIEV